MNIERAKPRLAGGFRPFSLRTSEGREYAVPHPEFVLIGRHSLAVLDADREIASLDPIHIVAIKDLPARKNGARKRRVCARLSSSGAAEATWLGLQVRSL